MKNAKVGSEVTSHQDSSFLFTTPKLSCLGLWLALDDATLENGCLWARMGSHKGPLYNRWRRKTPETREMLFENFLLEQNSKEKSPLKGAELSKISHQKLNYFGYSALPCKAGDLVLIHGQVEHLSLANTSEKQRHTYQLHLVEGKKEGIHWDKLNWLQYPEGKEFPSLISKHT